MHKGASVRRQGGLLQVFAEGRRTAETPVHDLGQLVLMGNVILTPSALDLLIERGVDTVFLTLHGRYRGRLVHGASGHIRLRLAQYKRLSEPTEALATARAIVQGKILNMRTFLVRWARRNESAPAVAAAILALRAAAGRSEVAHTLDQARGCEGSATAAYFRAFPDMIRADGFHFDGRNRRPPMDPVNALLSLGYTLLANAVEAAVAIVGLDPYLGSLHAPETNRPSLACDLMEEFRVPLVDALVLAAVNKGAVRVDDFEYVGPGEPVVIRRDGLVRFVRMMEGRFDHAVRYEPQGRTLTYRQIIEQQVRRFARYVLGEAPAYEPFGVR
jgi:CRISPR-associated protein Cas1